MTFTGGIPLLYPVGMFCIFVSYWMDKYLFLRFYLKPPLYDDGMAVRARSLVKLSLIVHCMMSIMIYSNSEIFHYDESDFSLYGLREDINELIVDATDRDIFDLRNEIDGGRNVLHKYVTWYKAHSIIYMGGLLIFICTVILEEVFGFFTYIGMLFSIPTVCLTKKEEEIKDLLK